MNKMPDGSFAVDSEQFEIVRDSKAPYIPTLKSKGGSSELPPEVENAIETGGMGYTTEEVVPAFNIEWDGNTEGLEIVWDVFFKISDKVYTEDELVGANGEYIYDDITYKGTVSLYIPETGGGMDIMRSYTLSGDVPSDFSFNQTIVTMLEDIEFEVEGEVVSYHKGTYFKSSMEGIYTSRIYKEASTQEVVHQIDEKYIPSSGGGVVVNITIEEGEEGYSISGDKTYDELNNALLSGIPILAKVGAGSAVPEYSEAVSNMVSKMQFEPEQHVICFTFGTSGGIACTSENEWQMLG